MGSYQIRGVETIRTMGNAAAKSRECPADVIAPRAEWFVSKVNKTPFLLHKGICICVTAGLTILVYHE